MRSGWHRQAQLGDGYPGRGATIAKAFGLDDATQLNCHLSVAHRPIRIWVVNL
jgi:hypothetical protein